MGHSASRASRTQLKTALVGALSLAEKGVDGLPIPGVQGCISGILKIIEQEELRKANLETFRGLVHTITTFETVTVNRLSKKGNLPEDLKYDVEILAKQVERLKLNEIPAQYTEQIGERSTKRRLKSFFLASDHAEALNNLGVELKSAIELFQTASLVNIQIWEQEWASRERERAQREKESVRRERERDAEHLIDRLAVERKSFWNAHREHPIELCEPGTRVSLLTDVVKWAESTGSDQHRILWLNGRAGVGKSTIAKTLATYFHDQNKLGATFMFSVRNEVTNGSVMFTTLAYQLAQRFPEFRHHLAAAIQAKQDSIHAGISQQFEDLLAAPLSQSQPLPDTVIILDALDECSPETLSPMLTVLVKNIVRFPFLRVIVTSRPETTIRQVLRRSTKYVREVDVSYNDESGHHDIARYLRGRLRNAGSHLVDDPDYNGAWLDQGDLVSLVDMADGLFVFASTAVRYITDERATEPQRRLKAILHGGHVGSLSTLDTMYLGILRNALPEGKNDLHARFQVVIGTIIFGVNNRSVKALVEMLRPQYGAGSIRDSLKFLHSVVVVPEEDDKEGLQISHRPFEDFITDSKRCTLREAYLQPSTHYARLCHRYLDLVMEPLSDIQSPSDLLDRLVGSTTVIIPDQVEMTAKALYNPVLEASFNVVLQIHRFARSLKIEDGETAGKVQLELVVKRFHSAKELIERCAEYWIAIARSSPLGDFWTKMYDGVMDSKRFELMEENYTVLEQLEVTRSLGILDLANLVLRRNDLIV